MASYKVFIKPSAVKELLAVPKTDRLRTIGRIQNLATEPWPAGAEKLSGQERYRIRQGDYRVVYAMDDDEQSLVVFKIGHRREAYRP